MPATEYWFGKIHFWFSNLYMRIIEAESVDTAIFHRSSSRVLVFEERRLSFPLTFFRPSHPSSYGKLPFSPANGGTNVCSDSKLSDLIVANNVVLLNGNPEKLQAFARSPKWLHVYVRDVSCTFKVWKCCCRTGIPRNQRSCFSGRRIKWSGWLSILE